MTTSEELNLQKAGALAMVIKIGSSQRASDYALLFSKWSFRQVRARSALSRFLLIISFALKPAWVNDALLLGRAATAANTTPEVWVAPVILDF